MTQIVESAPPPQRASRDSPARGKPRSLVLGGEREMLGRERTQALFAALEDETDSDGDSSAPPRPSTSIELYHLSLSGKSFGAEAAAVAAAHLSRLRPDSLRIAHLADIIAGRPEEEALRVLRQITEALRGHELLELDLSDNALGAKGVRACEAVFTQQHRLERLYLCNNGLAADAARLIVSLLLPDDQKLALRKLHLFNNLLQDEGAEALAPLVAHSPHLEDLRFSALRVSRRGSVSMSRALTEGTRRLRRLDWSDNTLGEEGGAALAEALALQPDLEEVLLRDCLLTDRGALPVLNALARRGASSRLRLLDMSGNELSGGQGARALARVIEASASLQVLRADENELRNTGAVVLARALQHRPPQYLPLTEVSLYMNEIGSRGARALVHSALSSPQLQRLNLNGNGISGETLEQLEAELRRNHRWEILAPLDENDEDAASEEEEEEEEEEEPAAASADAVELDRRLEELSVAP
eukprot:ctg_572.g256